MKFYTILVKPKKACEGGGRGGGEGGTSLYPDISGITYGNNA